MSDQPIFRWSRWAPLETPPVLGVLAVAAQLVLIGPRAWWLVADGAVLALTLPIHEVLVIGPRGISFSFRWLWLMHYRRRYFDSDAHIELSEPWESDRPDCLSIRNSRDLTDDQDFAWPMREAGLRALHERCTEALAQLRQERLRQQPRDLIRLAPALQHLAAAVDVPSARRNTWGRVENIALRAEATLAGVRLPPGTRLWFDADRYRDPDVPDRVLSVEPSEPVTLPLLGLTARAGARLYVCEDGSRVTAAQAAFATPLVLGGWCLNGTETVSFSDAGEISGGVLATSRRWGDWEIPAGSRFVIWNEPFRVALYAGYLHVTLGAPMKLPELELAANDSVELDRDGRILKASPKKGPIRIPAGEITVGYVAIPLLASGHVDVQACRRYRILNRPGNRPDDPA